MGYLRWLGLGVAVGLAALAFAGDVQVSCPPGLRVFLDGELVGVSSAEQDGLYLTGVPRGAHTLRVEKDGFLPHSLEVEVGEWPVEIRVDELVPAPPPRPEGPAAAPGAATHPEEAAAAPPSTARLGRLLVTSAPQNCEVEVDGRIQTKTSPRLEVGDLPPGEHTVVFRKPGYDPVSGVVAILPGAEHVVRGNLLEGRLEVVHHGKGSLRLTSRPVACTVRVAGLYREKTHPRLKLSHLPAGEHELVVSWGGRELSTTVLVADRRRTVVAVSFMEGDEPFVVSHEPE